MASVGKSEVELMTESGYQVGGVALHCISLLGCHGSRSNKKVIKVS